MFLNGVSETEQEKVRQVINRLLAVNFLVKEKEREAYMIVRRHAPEIKSFFQFLGWDLVVDERHECVFVHTSQRQFRKSLNKEQTVWLLILRLIYEEKRQEISLSEFPLTTTYEIKSKYETFRLPWLNRTTLDKYIRWCTNIQLLQPLDSDVRHDDSRFQLFHTWQYILNVDQLEMIRERIRRYTPQEEEGLLDEVVEKDETD